MPNLTFRQRMAWFFRRGERVADAQAEMLSLESVIERSWSLDVKKAVAAISVAVKTCDAGLLTWESFEKICRLMYRQGVSKKALNGIYRDFLARAGEDSFKSENFKLVLQNMGGLDGKDFAMQEHFINVVLKCAGDDFFSQRNFNIIYSQMADEKYYTKKILQIAARFLERVGVDFDAKEFLKGVFSKRIAYDNVDYDLQTELVKMLWDKAGRQFQNIKNLTEICNFRVDLGLKNLKFINNFIAKILKKKNRDFAVEDLRAIDLVDHSDAVNAIDDRVGAGWNSAENLGSVYLFAHAICDYEQVAQFVGDFLDGCSEGFNITAFNGFCRSYNQIYHNVYTSQSAQDYAQIVKKIIAKKDPSFANVQELRRVREWIVFALSPIETADFLCELPEEQMKLLEVKDVMQFIFASRITGDNGDRESREEYSKSKMIGLQKVFCKIAALPKEFADRFFCSENFDRLRDGPLLRDRELAFNQKESDGIFTSFVLRGADLPSETEDSKRFNFYFEKINKFAFEGIETKDPRGRPSIKEVLPRFVSTADFFRDFYSIERFLFKFFDQLNSKDVFSLSFLQEVVEHFAMNRDYDLRTRFINGFLARCSDDFFTISNLIEVLKLCWSYDENILQHFFEKMSPDFYTEENFVAVFNEAKHFDIDSQRQITTAFINSAVRLKKPISKVVIRRAFACWDNYVPPSSAREKKMGLDDGLFSAENFFIMLEAAKDSGWAPDAGSVNYKINRHFLENMPQDFFNEANLQRIISIFNGDYHILGKKEIIGYFLDRSQKSIFVEKNFWNLMKFFDQETLPDLVGRFVNNVSDEICTSSFLGAVLSLPEHKIMTLDGVGSFLIKMIEKTPLDFFKDQNFARFFLWDKSQKKFSDLAQCLLERVCKEDVSFQGGSDAGLEVCRNLSKLSMWDFLENIEASSTARFRSFFDVAARLPSDLRISIRDKILGTANLIDDLKNLVLFCLAEQELPNVTPKDFDKVQREFLSDDWRRNLALEVLAQRCLRSEAEEKLLRKFLRRMVSEKMSKNVSESGFEALNKLRRSFFAQESVSKDFIADLFVVINDSFVGPAGDDGGYKKINSAQFLFGFLREVFSHSGDKFLDRVFLGQNGLAQARKLIDEIKEFASAEVAALNEDIEVCRAVVFAEVAASFEGRELIDAVDLRGNLDLVEGAIYGDREDMVEVIQRLIPRRKQRAVIEKIDEIRAKHNILSQYNESQKVAEAKIFARFIKKSPESFAKIYEHSDFAVSAVTEFVQQDLENNFQLLPKILFEFRSSYKLLDIIKNILTNIGKSAVTNQRLDLLLSSMPADSRRNFLAFVAKKKLASRDEVLFFVKQYNVGVDLNVDFVDLARKCKARDLYGSNFEAIARDFGAARKDFENDQFSFKNLYCFFDIFGESASFLRRIAKPNIRAKFRFGKKTPVLTAKDMKVFRDFDSQLHKSYPKVKDFCDAIVGFIEKIPPLTSEMIGGAAIKLPPNRKSNEEAAALNERFRGLLKISEAEVKASLEKSKEVAQFFGDLVGVDISGLAPVTISDVAKVFATNKNRFYHLLCVKEGGVELFAQRVFSPAVLAAGCHANFGNSFVMALNYLLIENKAAALAYGFYAGSVFPDLNSKGNTHLDHDEDYDIFKAFPDLKINPIGFIDSFKSAIGSQALRDFFYPRLYEMLNGKSFRGKIPQNAAKEIDDFVMAIGKKCECEDVVEDCDNFMMLLVLREIKFERVMQNPDVAALYEGALKFESFLQEKQKDLQSMFKFGKLGVEKSELKEGDYNQRGATIGSVGLAPQGVFSVNGLNNSNLRVR